MNIWPKRRQTGLALSLGIILAIVLIGGCAPQPHGPRLALMYNRLAKHRDPARNPVIVIPGILGSKLVASDNNTIVWGAFTGDFADPQRPEGARLVALPMVQGAALQDLRDQVRLDGALDRIKFKLFGLPITLHAYLELLVTLGVGGYRDELLGQTGAIDYGDDHYTCFQFDYDWRRDNVENARRLHRFILQKKAYVEGEIRRRFNVQDPNVKFDLVAHSMGGLIARYYLRYGDTDLPEDGSAPALTWAGAEHVERVILVGTPNAGTAKALKELVEGLEFSPLLPQVAPSIIGTFPSVYQLLPRDRHHAVLVSGTGQRVENLYDPKVWEQKGWGLAARDQDRMLEMLMPTVTDPSDRRRIALDHLGKCLRRAERFAAALDLPAAPPAGLDLHLFAGDAEPTPAAVSVDGAAGKVTFVQWAPGDGTVTRASALMDERLDGDWTPALQSPIHWKSVRFLFTDHLGLTKDPAFTDNVLYLLLEDPR